ncbi:hypothetical protein OBPA_09350 [Polaribacter sp. OB-PA-B3]
MVKFKRIVFTSPLDNLSGKFLENSIPFFNLYKSIISIKETIKSINKSTLEISKNIGTKKPTTKSAAIIPNK